MFQGPTVHNQFGRVCVFIWTALLLNTGAAVFMFGRWPNEGGNMGLVVEGALVGRTALGQPKPNKNQLYAWVIQDEIDGSRLEVLSSDILGEPGEMIRVAVNPRVKRNTQNGQNLLTDSVTLWAAGGGNSATLEESWSVPARSVASRPANHLPSLPAMGNQREAATAQNGAGK